MFFYLFTFRPQTSETNLFEQFLTILKPALEDSKTIKKYAYSVEEDNSLNVHIHLLAGFEETKSKNNPLTQFFNTKPFRDFKQTLKLKQTNEPNGFDDRKVQDTKEDFLKVLGYVNKETVCRRRANKGFTNEEILEGIEYYYTTQHIDKSKDQSKNNWKILTHKNVLAEIEYWMDNNNVEKWSPIQKVKMIQDRYSFTNFSQKNLLSIEHHINIARTEDGYAMGYQEQSHSEHDSAYYEMQMAKQRKQYYELKEEIAKDKLQLIEENEKLREDMKKMLEQKIGVL